MLSRWDALRDRGSAVSVLPPVLVKQNDRAENYCKDADKQRHPKPRLCQRGAEPPELGLPIGEALGDIPRAEKRTDDAEQSGGEDKYPEAYPEAPPPLADGAVGSVRGDFLRGAEALAGRRRRVRLGELVEQQVVGRDTEEPRERDDSPGVRRGLAPFTQLRI